MLNFNLFAKFIKKLFWFPDQTMLPDMASTPHPFQYAVTEAGPSGVGLHACGLEPGGWPSSPGDHQKVM